MAIYDNLKTYHQIEANNLKGLQAGFVVAQMPVESTAKATLAPNNMMENGQICEISADGIKVGTNEAKALFIHYTEPLNTVVPGAKFFAVNITEECPRLVQLIPGDEWMSDIDGLEGTYTGRIIKLDDSKKQGDDDWFAMKTLADGTEAHHYMFLG